MTLPAWPGEKLAGALEALAKTARLVTASRDLSPPREDLSRAGPRAVAEWIEAAAEYLGIEAQSVSVGYSDLRAMLLAAGPALVELPGGGFLAVVGPLGKRKIKLLSPSLFVTSFSLDEVVAAVVAPLEESVSPEVDACLEMALASPDRRPRARRALMAEHLSTAEIPCCHILRRTAAAALTASLRSRAVGGNLVIQLVAHLLGLLLSALAWSTVAVGVFSDHFERAWLWAAIALLVSAIPLQVLEDCYAWLLELELGTRLKEWLLLGVLRLAPEEIAHEGAGGHLARVIEAESIQSHLLTGATFSMMSAFELGLAWFILRAGPGSFLGVVLLAWCGVLTILAGVYGLRLRTWTQRRVTMTSANVERLVGHATRLVQEDPARWHEGEDRQLEPYVTSSRSMDDALRRVQVVAGRGWLLVGLLALIPVFAKPGIPPSSLALALAGVLFARSALMQMVSSFFVFIDIGIGARTVIPLMRAAHRPRRAGIPSLALASAGQSEAPGSVLMEGRDLVYQYPGRGEPVLRRCDLRIAAGDRVLLEGASGSGKSTLGSLLTGLRQPSSGVLLLQGLDPRSLGEGGWRRRVVGVPQFHENYIFTGTLAHNLLMGNRWPSTDDDIEAAEELCRELGLGGLIDRMPSGMQTIVGESGWQLSHGERSRVYLARGLLQQSEVVVLDESFAALDPETLDVCMRAVLARASTLVLIAHP